MVRIFQRIWKDIRRGESIDVYVLIILAIVLAILNVINVVPATWVLPVTLAVLALMAIAILGNRYRLEEVQTNLSKDILLTERPPDWRDKLEKASDLYLVGGTLSRTIKDLKATIEMKLKRGETVKVLVGDPEGRAYSTYLQTVRPDSGAKDPDAAKDEIYGTLKMLRKMKQLTSDKLEIKVLDYFISQGFIACDPDRPSGTLYIEYYPFNNPQDSLPKLAIRPEDGYWYTFFKGQLDTIWENGRPWSCQSADNSR